ncbi:MAG TPA: hypothetical protein VFW03_26800, partial [Gemmatimonadaceae bacterium]|nr:hypothetical protein [Gemmatimonadaceae bacterium]
MGTSFSTPPFDLSSITTYSAPSGPATVRLTFVTSVLRASLFEREKSQFLHVHVTALRQARRDGCLADD